MACGSYHVDKQFILIDIWALDNAPVARAIQEIKDAQSKIIAKRKEKDQQNLLVKLHLWQIKLLVNFV